MAEAWRAYYTEAELAAIQKIELDSLDVLASVCEQLGIDFFLYGGSLLGAVKYGGFVPWDDDLDIALVRKDYEKLLKEGPALLPDEYELQEPRINKRTPYPFMKLRRKNTAMVEYMYRNIKINHGVYFDIYPIDNLPDDDEELRRKQKQILKISRLLQRRQTASLFKPREGLNDLVKQGMVMVQHLMVRLIPHQYLINKMNEIMTRCNDVETRRQGNMFFPEPVNYFDGIYPTVEVVFEGRKMLIPQGYKTNLENRYGDVTKDLPEDRRVGHRPYVLKLDIEEDSC